MAGDAPRGDGAPPAPPTSNTETTGAAGVSAAAANGAPAAHGHAHAGFWGLTIGAIGVVFGDIGTSPLYTMKEVFAEEHGIEIGRAHV